MVSIETILQSWLPLVGGITGAIIFLYAGWNIYANHKRHRQLEEIILKLNRVEAMLLVKK